MLFRSWIFPVAVSTTNQSSSQHLVVCRFDLASRGKKFGCPDAAAEGQLTFSKLPAFSASLMRSSRSENPFLIAEIRSHSSLGPLRSLVGVADPSPNEVIKKDDVLLGRRPGLYTSGWEPQPIREDTYVSLHRIIPYSLDPDLKHPSTIDQIAKPKVPLTRCSFIFLTNMVC